MNVESIMNTVTNLATTWGVKIVGVLVALVLKACYKLVDSTPLSVPNIIKPGSPSVASDGKRYLVVQHFH